jgi:hypothetical protein
MEIPARWCLTPIARLMIPIADPSPICIHQKWIMEMGGGVRCGEQGMRDAPAPISKTYVAACRGAGQLHGGSRLGRFSLARGEELRERQLDTHN